MFAKLSRLVIVTLVGLLAAQGAALAHPHVWVIMKTGLVFAPDGQAIGVRQAWTFDDMFSTFATQGLDNKQKGVFTREELAPLAKVNIESLKEFDYFTYAKESGKKIAFTDPVEYHLEFKDSMLTLHFVLPFKSPVKVRALDLEVFDQAYFIDFKIEENTTVALPGSPAGCTVTVGKPQEMSKELAQRLAQIGPGEQIPENSYGAQFANKIAVKCP